MDFYDNSLANELANEKDVAELLVQGATSESSPVDIPAAPEPVAASSNKLNLLSLASDISSAEAKTESSLTSEKAHTSVEESILTSSEAVSLPVESETPAFSPKIGKKDELSHTTHPVKEAEISLESPRSEVIEDFFPNLVVGFEEDEKAEYVREVAKNLSESRKGGLISLFGGRAMIHTTIAIAAIAGVTAFSVFVMPGILHTIKGNSIESHKGTISADIPANPAIPHGNNEVTIPENKVPTTENKPPVGDIVPSNPQNQTVVPPPVKSPEQNGGNPVHSGTMTTTETNPPVTQITPVTYKE